MDRVKFGGWRQSDGERLAGLQSQVDVQSQQVRPCRIQMEAISFEKVRSVQKGSEIICIRDASTVAVTFQPDMKLHEPAELHVAKGGGWEGSGDNALFISV